MHSEDFDKLLSPYQGKMFRFARSILGRTEDAEDLIQDIFLKLWTRRSQLMEIQKLDPYLMQMVRNMALNRLNKKGNTWDSLDEIKTEIAVMNTVEQLERQDTEKMILNLIEALPIRQRTVFKLREVEHYEVEQIAELLETDINNIRVNLSIARKGLKKKYEELVKHETR